MKKAIERSIGRVPIIEMRDNVLSLVKTNSNRENQIPITIGLRSYRTLNEMIEDPDFQPILQYKPEIDFTWSFTSAGGRISRTMLPEGMNLRTVSVRKEPCVQLFNGPMILPNGTVIACSCVAAMDALKDLAIGNIMENSLVNLWRDDRLKKIRAGFGTANLNKTCASCDMYRDLELYKTHEGRKRARINVERANGQSIRRIEKPKGAFNGG